MNRIIKSRDIYEYISYPTFADKRQPRKNERVVSISDKEIIAFGRIMKVNMWIDVGNGDYKAMINDSEFQSLYYSNPDNQMNISFNGDGHEITIFYDLINIAETL